MICPCPAQEPHPPVWIPGGGSVETYDFCIENQYSFSFLSYFGHKYANKVLGPFWVRNDELGGDRNPYKTGICQFIFVSETDERAQLEYEEHIRYFFSKCMHADRRFAEAPGYRTAKSLRAGLRSQFDGSKKDRETMLKDGAMTWQDLIEEGFIVAGSPATVRDRLRDVLQNIRAGNVSFEVKIAGQGEPVVFCII